MFFLKYELHLHGAAWCCCTSSCIFARRAAKAARYAGALYSAHGRNFFGEATVRERHVILVGPNNLNCETMQTLNNNVETYYIYYLLHSLHMSYIYMIYHWNLLCSQTIQPVPLSRQSLEAPWAQEMGKWHGNGKDINSQEINMSPFSIETANLSCKMVFQL